MKRFAVSVVVSVALGVLLLPLILPTPAPAANRPGRQRMDGLGHTTWWVELKPQGQSPMPDLLTFERGKFDSYVCKAYGFGNGKYTTARQGKAETFAATTKSNTQGVMEWKGSVEGDGISGTLLWKPATGAPKTMTFSGTRHAAKGMLDATTWKVDLNAAGQKPMPDTLVFGKGVFDSKACHTYGFGKGPYNATRKGENTSFAAFTTSASQGMMAWNGEVKGDKVSGTMTWYPTKGAAKTFSFEGTKTGSRRRH